MFRCPACNSEMIWNSDFDFQDVGRDGDGVESVHVCSNQNCESEFFHVTKFYEEE